MLSDFTRHQKQHIAKLNFYPLFNKKKIVYKMVINYI